MLRWVSDIFLGAAISYFANQRRQSSNGAMLKVGSILIRRAVFYGVSSLITASLVLGALFIMLVDLGNYINAFGAIGLTAVGQLGFLLLVVAGIAFFVIYKTPIGLKPEEAILLEAQTGASMGEVALSALVQHFQKRHANPTDPGMSQDRRHESDNKEKTQFNHDQSWSAYTN